MRLFCGVREPGVCLSSDAVAAVSSPPTRRTATARACLVVSSSSRKQTPARGKKSPPCLPAWKVRGYSPGIGCRDSKDSTSGRDRASPAPAVSLSPRLDVARPVPLEELSAAEGSARPAVRPSGFSTWNRCPPQGTENRSAVASGTRAASGYMSTSPLPVYFKTIARELNSGDAAARTHRPPFNRAHVPPSRVAGCDGPIRRPNPVLPTAPVQPPDVLASALARGF